VGKLPRGLPAWFEQLDTDKDGQIGLYEWKGAGRPIAEFLAMDLNRDGFVTVEEALRYQKARPASAPRGTAIARASAVPGAGQPLRGTGADQSISPLQRQPRGDEQEEGGQR
jgi:hypothetical protein